MPTKDTIQGYLTALQSLREQDWVSFFSEDMHFVSPNQKIQGRDAYIAGTKRFFSMVTSVTVEDMLIDGKKACALTCYQLQSPKGNTLTCPVAEIFTVKDNKIATYVIYFDTSPFPSFFAEG